MSTRRRSAGVAALLLLLLLQLAGCADDAAEPPSASPPVFLVPGFGGSTSDLALVAGALEEDGREVQLVELDPSWDDLATQEDLLDAAVGDEDEVDVVGFSAGGLVARLWATQGGSDAARRVVTLATPNHGTSPAVLGSSCTGGCAQLLAGSELVTGLNAGDETPAGVDWVTIWSATDGVVVPATSARLEGALDVRVQDVCPDVAPSHLQMLTAPVPALVVAVLDGGAPEVPPPSACETS